jgi:hypothetical protein
MSSFVCLFSQSVGQSVSQSVGQAVSRAFNSYILRENLFLQVVGSSGKLESYVVATRGHNKGDSYMLFNDAVYL